MEKKSWNKIGASHVEMILAFVIFIGFLIFALIFLNPLDNSRLLDSTLIYAYDEVSKNISVPMYVYSVTGFSVPDSKIRIPIENPEGSGIKVEDYNGNTLNSGYDNGNVIVERGSQNFIRIFISDDFERGSELGGTQLSEGDYKISSSDIRHVISERLIKELKDNYEEDYDNLKSPTRFNLPRRTDFAFSLVFDNGNEVSADIGTPEDIEVVAKRERVETIRLDDSIVFADLIVKIW